ncbi:hypothetical protein ACELLULO517_25475 [Acidisoma cellulosilytica]|uniref:Uncharacterized protein n=1 Tax=Acidisoma cellulosilyticum TaxID=2802395 RepID=A0A963Z7S9_9PROT|nr:hypothetical protein [Acidisoma cellulosilyticum]MCB8883625.1 hypothetical protein [Acidisoma cellulosilyticum]
MNNRDITRLSVRRIEERAPNIPLFCVPEAPTESLLPAGETLLDDATLSYVVAAQPAFDLLRQAAGQLAALLVLAAAGGRSAQDNPAFALACAERAKAGDLIGALPTARKGRHHHRHLRACNDALTAACAEAAVNLNRDDQRALALLREGLRQLHFAAAALPGFEVVAFGQSCCAAHASMATISRGKANG